MHPPHAAEIRSISALTQRRAAPMPRVPDSVSEKVLRVPKPTSVRMSRSMRAGDAPAMMSKMRSSTAGGGVPRVAGGAVSWAASGVTPTSEAPAVATTGTDGNPQSTAAVASATGLSRRSEERRRTGSGTRYVMEMASSRVNGRGRLRRGTCVA